MKLIIQSKANSFILNGIEYQKGAVPVNHSANGISINQNYAELSEVECDGQVFGSVTELNEWISENLFKNGGGSGSGAVETVTGDLVNNTDPTNPIVNLPSWVNDIREDRVGYLNISSGFTYTLGTNWLDATKVMSSASPSGVATGTFIFPNIPNTFKRHAIIFLVDIDEITISKQPLVTEVFNVPTKAKRGDIWNVTWDIGDRQWHLEAINSMPKWYIDDLVGSVGTNVQVQGFEDGKRVPITIGVKHLTDIGGFPSFSNGVLTATAMNPTDQTALLSFIEFSNATPKSGTFPTYKTGGVIAVNAGISDNDATNLKQVLGSVTVVDESTEELSSPYSKNFIHFNGTEAKVIDLPNTATNVGKEFFIRNTTDSATGYLLTLSGQIYDSGMSTVFIDVAPASTVYLISDGVYWMVM